MSAEQFMAMEEDPIGPRTELVEGEIVVCPSSAPLHSFANIRLTRILDEHIETKNVGVLLQDVDTVLNFNTVRRPDILYFTKARKHLVTAKRIKGPPDLAIEVISPGSVRTDRVAKFAEYAAAGVEYYWIIDPESREIEAWHLESNQYVSCGRGRGAEVIKLPPFPDLEISLSRLWMQ